MGFSDHGAEAVRESMKNTGSQEALMDLDLFALLGQAKRAIEIKG
jgi:hypothetical protein